jgi:hypothetical protein
LERVPHIFMGRNKATATAAAAGFIFMVSFFVST